MSVLETAATVPDKILDAVKTGQDAVLSAVGTLTSRTRPLTEKLPASPLADRLPKPAAVVDSYFGFAQKVLANQKDFALKLAESYKPAKPVKPAAKTGSKAAAKSA
jgi:hypothetical protein